METLKIIKIGGNIIDNDDALLTFIKGFSTLKGPKILVHGGGKLATKLAEQMGVSVTMVEGRRITDSDTLDIITMVYAGKINKHIVAHLQANHCNSIGFSGADGNSIVSEKRPIKDIDYGYVGDVKMVNTHTLEIMLKNKITPVFCAITHDENGQLLNTNADTIASEIAIGLATIYNTELYYCFEKNGVLENVENDDSVIENINTETYKTLIENGIIYEGMLPKLNNCFHAINHQVQKVCIGKSEMLFNTNTKTYNHHKMIERLTKQAIALLKQLIETQSFSSEEDKTALLIENWFNTQEIPFKRDHHNIWTINKYFEESKPTLLLNSHHDTVKPNNGYTKDPLKAIVEDGKLYGLGSNDAGGCLVSLIATFTYFYDKKDLNYNLVIVASAEEESSGPNGLNSMLKIIPKIDVAIVGEPTLMNLAVAEKGLVVFDAKVKGTASHAAHPNDDNAIYNTINVLKWFKDYKFERKSPVLGDVKITVTQINAGKQHNAVPAEVDLVIDVRVNDKYSNQEIADILTQKSPCTSIIARSLRLNSSSIPINHDLVKAGIELGRETYGSPTLSDQSVLTCPSLKLGPGDSTRSHTADEFIYLAEIEEGVKIYIELLEKVL